MMQMQGFICTLQAAQQTGHKKLANVQPFFFCLSFMDNLLYVLTPTAFLLIAGHL